MLNYLEPDIILQKKGILHFIDAKYKAYMLNPQSFSSVLKETFRADLHQVLAYSSFDSSKDKTVILIYPCNKFKRIKLEAINNIRYTHNHIFLIGLPFTTVGLNTLIKQVSRVLRK